MDLSLTYTAAGRTVTSKETENDDYLLEITQPEGAESLPGAETSAGTPSFSPEGTRITVKIRAKRPLTMADACITLPQRLAPSDRICVNGYQSWTDTREFGFDESLHDIRKVPAFIRDRFHFEAYGDSLFHPYKKNELHGYTFGYVRHPEGDAELIGSYNDGRSFLILCYEKDNGRVRLQSDCEGAFVEEGGTFTLFDFVCLSGKPGKILEKYFRAFGTCKAKPVRGYTSWYRFYQDINEKKMLENLQGIDSSEFDLFQIDDGFETFVGDWLDVDPAKFPSGLSPIVNRIHEKGLMAGIWLAPFVCEKDSRLFREHPDWVLRGKDGEPVWAGCNWSTQAALDIRREDVRAYIREVLQHYSSMGFDLFKLDFLYAAAMAKERAGLTRAQLMRDGMELLRECLGDKLILGCGVPLASAFGLVDYCRIGPDISLKFDDVFYMRPMHRERISTKVTLQNTIFRHCMDGTVFRCDPDVFLLRDTEISLSKEQRRAVVMLNHLCGSVYMTSDDVGRYDPEKRALLEEARKLCGASVRDIVSDGRFITITFCLPGEQEEKSLRYDTHKGELSAIIGFR